MCSLRVGRWLAVEVKLGSGKRLDEAARSLTRACEQIDASRVGEPAKKLVITAAGYGDERPDGVTVAYHRPRPIARPGRAGRAPFSGTCRRV